MLSIQLTTRPKSAVQSPGTASKFYTINGFFLPNSEFQSKDDERVSTALGMVAHLLSLIAELFDVPLRYPVLLKSSRSSIFDYISETSASNQ
jgi:hypothetical protein